MSREFDVIVVGAGPAGVAAAIAAGRSGARTLLIERSSCAGGSWTSACMNLVFDYHNKSGVMQEIREKLEARKAWEEWDNWPGSKAITPAVFGVEEMKALLDDLLVDAGVAVRYQTLLLDASTGDGRIQSVTTASKSGLETWAAHTYVDASGDGDLAARAGCSFQKGREDGKMQPGTMFGLVGGWPEPIPHHAEVANLLRELGYEPSYEHVTLFRAPGCKNIAYLMATHLYGMDACDAGSMSDALIGGRKQIRQMVGLLRRKSAFQDLCLLQTGPEMGIREGRRIAGHYHLAVDDLRTGKRFDDGICPVTFNIDVHHVDPNEGTGLWVEAVPLYQIPFRSLVARDVDNLLLAGRLISGDFLAHASYRVTGDCCAMGEVAGRAAAKAAEEGRPAIAARPGGL